MAAALAAPIESAADWVKSSHGFARIVTADGGAVYLKNAADRLREFADTVRRNWSAYGGGSEAGRTDEAEEGARRRVEHQKIRKENPTLRTDERSARQEERDRQQVVKADDGAEDCRNTQKQLSRAGCLP